MKSSSLRWRFTLGFIVLQACAIAASAALVIYLASAVSPERAVPSIWLSQEVADSIQPSAEGEPRLAPSESLEKTMAEWPTFWLLAEFDDGTIVSHGDVPEGIIANREFLRQFRTVEMHGYIGDPGALARSERLETPAGEATIFAGGVSMSQHGLLLWIGSVAVAVPALILATITLLGVPWVTRRSLRSLNDLNARLDRIDFEARGGAVDEAGLPREVLPVVNGINMALRRLDNGFETTERFFVNAAHELRTPIAILQVRIDTLPPSPEKTHLQSGVKRLTAITNQLLDIEKYRQQPPRRSRVELNGLVSTVVADLAPFAISEGYDISFEPDPRQQVIEGEVDALERAFGNLLRNAIQYGGRCGEITVRVSSEGSVLVTDQGQGIAPDKQARIFEPFYRINPHGSGAGLGLSMANDIVSDHGGFIEVRSAPGRGTTFAVKWREARVASL
ncbi:sensor histidine kinase [Aureimonas mangrovi]|uniref:sensor histidine kinase n=1 Tax=Aureimonas mangrovi TaxID=2758041 RepID=UPI00163DCA18|nr:HAMP domain-containing sensor histidine kinase [Aureimonas mangrovi]